MSEFAFQVLLTFDAALRLATPLILCALAGIFSERSGIIDISLEGKLLGSAFVAAAVASVSGSVYLGPLAALLLARTRFGLRLRAVGESPEAVDSAGVSVPWLRYRAVALAGVLCGVAGAYLSTAHGAGFIREMSAGKGYMALAAMVFGKWRPWPSLLACLLFGFLEAASARLQGVDLPLFGQAPTHLILVLPYVLTVVLLAGFFGRAEAPKALGTPYVKEH